MYNRAIFEVKCHLALIFPVALHIPSVQLNHVFQQVPWPVQDRHNDDGRSICIIGEDIIFLSSDVRRPADVLSPMILRQMTTSTYHKHS
jgi:hypothetical protein